MRGRSFWGEDGWSSSKVREDAIFCSVSGLELVSRAIHPMSPLPGLGSKP